jgi:hypothetical protein
MQPAAMGLALEAVQHNLKVRRSALQDAIVPCAVHIWKILEISVQVSATSVCMRDVLDVENALVSISQSQVESSRTDRNALYHL